MTRARSAIIWAVAAQMILAAYLVEVLVVLPLVDHDRAWSWGWPIALGLGFLAAESLVVHLHLGRESYAFSVMEIPLVLGLFFVRPDVLVVSRVLGAVLAMVIARRSLQKTLFNAALFALETVCAVTVWQLIVGVGDPLGPRGWLAAGAAVLVTSILSSLLVGVAVTVVTGHWPPSLVRLFAVGQLGDLVNVCFAIVAVYIVTVEWRAAWLLVVIAGVLVFAYRSYEGARKRSESLEQVNRFTELVGREVELEALVGTVLAEVREAFDVSVAQLRLTQVGGQERDWVLDGTATAPRWATLIRRLDPDGTGESLLVTRKSRPRALAAVLDEAGVRDCILVSMRSEGRTVGSLLAAGKKGDVETFTPADLRQLRALANHAAVAIDNAVRAHLLVAQAEERERQAVHDDLTGLPNRRLLGRRLGDALARDRAAVLLLDLDGFRDVNDTLGHEIGDQLLCLVADRLRDAVVGESVVARIGGDEFAVLLPGADENRVRGCVALVQSALARPFDLGGVTVSTDVSLGVALAERGTDAVTALRWADLAMYAAKSNRTGVELFRPELDRRDAGRLGMLGDLREAVASDGLQVHYQPKVDLASGRTVGVEALARWDHPLHGAIGPEEFIPLAEHSSLITPLTMLMLRTALRDCRTWRVLDADFSVAVNISPRSLLDPSLVTAVADALRVADVPAEALTLEITETSLMGDPERAIAALRRLRAIGVRLSVDDLGTGYSSLAYLQRLPVDEIKIDRSFVMALPDPSAEAVVGAIVDLGHRLGHHVVAEGIEDAAAYDLLRGLRCDTAQGFWMSRPLPAHRLTRFLAGAGPLALTGLRRVR